MTEERWMQAVPPMDIYATMWLYLSEERLDLKPTPHFFTQTLKIKLLLDVHVPVKTISSPWRQTYWEEIDYSPGVP